MKIYITAILLLLQMISTCSAQSVVHADPLLDRNISAIFQAYPAVDSIRYYFYKGKPNLLQVYQHPSSSDIKHVLDSKTTYVLSFKWDTRDLKEKFPLLHDFVNDRPIHDFIVADTAYPSFWLTLSRHSITKMLGAGQAQVFAEIKKSLLDSFTDHLCQSLKDYDLKNTADSILVLQAVVEPNGTLSNMELLYGNDSLLDFFKQNYSEFQNDIIAPQRLFLPYINEGSLRRGLVDIYLKIHVKGVVELAVTGRFRKLRLKNFMQDPSNPIFFY